MTPKEQAKAVQLLTRVREWADLIQWGADVTALPPAPGFLTEIAEFIGPKDPDVGTPCICPFPRTNCPETCRRGCVACATARAAGYTDRFVEGGR